MKRLVLLALTLLAGQGMGAVQTIREVTFGVTSRLAPIFDKGYLLSLEPPCGLAVYRPDGSLAFRKTLSNPEEGSCSVMSAAIDVDGTVAAAISHRDGLRSAGIHLLDLHGERIRFIDTKLYLPSFITFDRDHALWSAGSQQDPAKRGHADSQDYNVVRKYSRTGEEVGSFFPRSMWKPKLEPAGGTTGYWHIAAAEDRIGAMFYDHTENTPEWVEWDLTGKLLSRTSIQQQLHGGRAYTSNGKLYGRILTREPGLQQRLSVLDAKSGTWSTVTTELPRDAAMLLGADGKVLVFWTGTNSTALWVAVE